MKVPHLYKFKKLKKQLKKHNIQWQPKGGKGSHGVFIGKNIKTGKTAKFSVPHAKQKKEITGVYIKAILRRFGLDSDILNK